MSNLAHTRMTTAACPYCDAREGQVRAGCNRAGTQRYVCRPCGRGYTPEPKPAGRTEEVRRRALMLYAAGMSVRGSAKFVGVNHQTVANWVEAACAQVKGGGPGPDALAAQVAVRRRMVLQEREWRRYGWGK